MEGAEAISIFSELEEKVYRMLFLKHRWLLNDDSIPFRYIRDV
jgi:hypothetical protein